MTIVIDGTTGISGVDGTASNPSYEGTDSNTGIFFPAADTIAFTEGGVESARFTSAGALQLNANLTFSGTGNRITGDFSNATLANRVAFQSSTTNGETSLFVIPNGTSTTTRIQLGDASNLGGSGNSLNLFNTGSEVSIRAGTYSGGTGLPMTFYTGGSERMRIDTSGNVGIGTSSPSQKLEVNGRVLADSLSVSSTVFLWSQNRMSLGASIGLESQQSTPLWMMTNTTQPIVFGTNNTERARITSGGYFKATSTGTYSAGTTGAVHEFDTSSVDGTIVNFYNQAASNPNGIYVGYTAADPNDATRYVFGAQQNTGTWIYRIYSNGTVAARSDVKWKKNIETARDGYVEDLAKLRVVKYNWYNHEDGTPKELGLIAQEVEQVFPGLVVTDEQTRNEVKTREIPAVLDEEGNEVEPARTEEYTEKVGTGEYSKSIKFSVLPIMLLKAIQEQQQMIEELKAEVQALKGTA